MAWRLAGSLVKLREQLNAAYPNRSKVSDGSIGDAAHAAVPSDHNPNSAGVVCAIDITHSPSTGLDAHALADRLIVNRHPTLKYVISNYRIAGDWTGWKWVRYYGSNPHDKHIHVSVGRGNDGYSVQPYDDSSNWNIMGEGVEDMIGDTDNEFSRWNQLHKQLLGYWGSREVFRQLAVGKTWLRQIEILSDHKDAKIQEAMANLGRLASNDNWQGQIYSLQAYVKELQGSVSASSQMIAALQQQIKELGQGASAEEVKALQDQIDAYREQDVIDQQNLTEARKKLETLEAEKAKATETGNLFTRWIGDLINKMVGAK